MKEVNGNEFQCPIYSILRLVSAKWTVEIMREIAIQPTRTRQFLSRIPGLSMKCLQERIKELEGAGMLKRIRYEEKVPKVEHHITERGQKLLKIMIDIKALAGESASESCCCPIEAHIENTPQEDTHCPRRRELVDH